MCCLCLVVIIFLLMYINNFKSLLTFANFFCSIMQINAFNFVPIQTRFYHWECLLSLGLEGLSIIIVICQIITFWLALQFSCLKVFICNVQNHNMILHFMLLMMKLGIWYCGHGNKHNSTRKM